MAPVAGMAASVKGFGCRPGASGRSGIGREAKDVGQNAIVHQRVLAENVEVGLLDFLPVDGVLILGFRH